MCCKPPYAINKVTKLDANSFSVTFNGFDLQCNNCGKIIHTIDLDKLNTIINKYLEENIHILNH